MGLTISQRCGRIAPSITLSIDAKAKEMNAQGLDVVGFGAGEPDFNTPDYIVTAAKEALDKGVTRYTPASGTLELRKAICEKLKNDNGLTYKPSEVIVSNGAKHTLFNIFQAILEDGDEVLIPAPCWVSYPEMVTMSGGVPVIVSSTEEMDFLVTADMLEKYITPKTKALILNSPNNPNGCVWNREMLTEIAKSAVKHGYYVVSDEIYEKLIYDGREHVSIASINEDIKKQTIVVNGLSKAYAMTGWRIGYAAGPADVISAMGNHQSHSTSNPNSIAQYAGTVALKGGKEQIAAMAAEFDARRIHLFERINAIEGLSCRMPHGAFYIMMNISAVLGKSLGGKVIIGSVSFADMLLDSKFVAVVPGAAFEADNYVRLSYATSLKNIDKGLDRIEEFIKELK